MRYLARSSSYNYVVCGNELRNSESLSPFAPKLNGESTASRGYAKVKLNHLKGGGARVADYPTLD